jgi:hypothetical protein
MIRAWPPSWLDEKVTKHPIVCPLNMPCPNKGQQLTLGTVHRAKAGSVGCADSRGQVLADVKIEQINETPQWDECLNSTFVLLPIALDRYTACKIVDRMKRAFIEETKLQKTPKLTWQVPDFVLIFE